MKYHLAFFSFFLVLSFLFGFGSVANAGRESQSATSVVSSKSLVIQKRGVSPKNKEEIFQKRKDALTNLLFRMVSRLVSFEEKIKSNSQIKEEKKNEILSQTDERLLELEKLKDQLETFSTLEELQTLGATIREFFPKERTVFRIGGREGIESRFSIMIERLEKLEERFDALNKNFESKGIQDATFSTLLEEYHGLLLDLKAQESVVREIFEKEGGKRALEEARKVALLLKESQQKATQIFEYLEKLSSLKSNLPATE